MTARVFLTLAFLTGFWCLLWIAAYLCFIRFFNLYPRLP